MSSLIEQITFPVQEGLDKAHCDYVHAVKKEAIENESVFSHGRLPVEPDGV